MSTTEPIRLKLHRLAYWALIGGVMGAGVFSTDEIFDYYRFGFIHKVSSAYSAFVAGVVLVMFFVMGGAGGIIGHGIVCNFRPKCSPNKRQSD